ncbi:amidohydrolase family protein [Pararhizobium gei]|uniref:amidohydrolase family protein n=1 Tax=Pararhizobium gei TaxID=1395951 RepID=UPI0023DC0E9E|nr:amidohydrolase family protein [Rhizobium gei]
MAHYRTAQRDDKLPARMLVQRQLNPVLVVPDKQRHRGCRELDVPRGCRRRSDGCDWQIFDIDSHFDAYHAINRRDTDIAAGVLSEFPPSNGENEIMRIIALEEHVMLPEMTQRIPASVAVEAGWVPSSGHWGPGPLNEALGDIQEGRIDAMNQAGLTLQVLSVIGPGAELLAGEEGISFARDYNDRLAIAVEKNPDRFAAFAHLPMKEPAAAADELERCVKKLGFRGASINGTTDGLFLDDPRFAPILARAEALGSPLYIHPGPPPRAVRDAYYSGLPGEISSYLLSNAGFGWHSETAIHILRLVLSGTLDRNPGLKLIIGHLGELLPMLLNALIRPSGREQKRDGCGPYRKLFWIRFGSRPVASSTRPRFSPR